MDIKFLDSEMNMPGGMVKLPLRCTAVQTSQGVILISPVEFSKDQYDQIDKLGKVVAIVSPSLIHHLFMQKAIDRYPEAVVWGAPGSFEKLPHILWNKIFETDTWPYEDEIQHVYIQGAMRLNEISLFHKSSRTLIVVDMCFHILHPKGWAAPIMLRLMGTYKKFAVSRLYKIMVKDREKFIHSLHELMKWDFEKIAMGHGELVLKNGKKMLIDAFEKRGY